MEGFTDAVPLCERRNRSKECDGSDKVWQTEVTEKKYPITSLIGYLRWRANRSGTLRISKGDFYKHLPRKEKAVLEVIVAIAAGGTGLATIALAVITGYYAYENRQMRIDAQKPQIVIYLHQFLENVPARTQTLPTVRTILRTSHPRKEED